MVADGAGHRHAGLRVRRTDARAHPAAVRACRGHGHDAVLVRRARTHPFGRTCSTAPTRRTCSTPRMRSNPPSTQNRCSSSGRFWRLSWPRPCIPYHGCSCRKPSPARSAVPCSSHCVTLNRRYCAKSRSSRPVRTMLTCDWRPAVPLVPRFPRTVSNWVRATRRRVAARQETQRAHLCGCAAAPRRVHRVQHGVHRVRHVHDRRHEIAAPRLRARRAARHAGRRLLHGRAGLRLARAQRLPLASHDHVPRLDDRRLRGDPPVPGQPDRDGTGGVRSPA